LSYRAAAGGVEMAATVDETRSMPPQQTVVVPQVVYDGNVTLTGAYCVS
jgi:hypothetical protein